MTEPINVASQADAKPCEQDQQSDHGDQCDDPGCEKVSGGIKDLSEHGRTSTGAVLKHCLDVSPRKLVEEITRNGPIWLLRTPWRRRSRPRVRRSATQLRRRSAGRHGQSYMLTGRLHYSRLFETNSQKSTCRPGAAIHFLKCSSHSNQGKITMREPVLTSRSSATRMTPFVIARVPRTRTRNERACLPEKTKMVYCKDTKRACG
jgi:hypothetical protein